MMATILFQNAHIVTMNAQRDLVAGDVLVRDDRIAAIVKQDDQTFRDMAIDRRIDASEWVILPGFVQTHVHLCQTLFRNQAEDLELLDWLQKKIWPFEAAHDEQSTRVSARLGIAELLAGGTTTILDMGSVHHYDAVFDELEKSGMRAAGGKCMMDSGENYPAGLRETAQDSLKCSRDLMERWHGAANGRLRYAYAPRFALSCSEKLLREVAEISAAKDCMMHTHSSENVGETRLVMQQTGKRNVDYLSSLGISGKRACLAHCIQIDETEISTIAREQTRVAHCPGSNLKLASGIAPVVKMRKAGVVVGLGADGAPCNNNLDMLHEMRLAALLQKISSGVGALSAPAVVEMATIDGARCLGWDDEIGSIEEGKKADLVAINMNGLHQFPSAEVYTQIVYASRASDVALTMVDGEILFEKSELKRIDAPALSVAAQQEFSRLAQRVGVTGTRRAVSLQVIPKIIMKSQPKEPPQIFLCYVRKDVKPVGKLYRKLSDAGLKPFMDSKDTLSDEDWKQKLMNTIREAPFFLACLSNNSVDERGVVQEEIREALDVWRQKLDSDIYFIPARLEDCEVPGSLAKFKWFDLFQDGGFERLKLAIDTGMERLGVIRQIRLRSQPLDNLTEGDVNLMLQENDFYDFNWYWMGKGIQHQYEFLQNGKVVFDKTTGLTWQQAGSKAEMEYDEAKQYIRELNKQRFGGYNDWRLPTLEEAMSLMEPKKNKNGLYIAPLFAKDQRWTWTADKESNAGVAWVVYFYGYCGYGLSYYYSVRAVR